MGECRRLCTLWSAHVLLLLIRTPTCSHGRIANALPRLVRRMVEQCANVMNEKWIEKLRDLLLVREVQRAIEWNPGLCQFTQHFLISAKLTKHP
jgi:hypothetical protein